jgi:hypothetical protein
VEEVERVLSLARVATGATGACTEDLVPEAEGLAMETQAEQEEVELGVFVL